MRAACHLDAARLQLAIGEWAGCDAHLRVCLALPRAPARTYRLQLLQLARARGDRGIEPRRRIERLAGALRQGHVPRLMRIRARHLTESRSRRAVELSAFLERHGEAALSGRVDTRGGSPMLDAFQDVLQICHETPDDLSTLTRVCEFVLERLHAACVAVYSAPLHQEMAFAAPRQAASRMPGTIGASNASGGAGHSGSAGNTAAAGAAAIAGAVGAAGGAAGPGAGRASTGRDAIATSSAASGRLAVAGSARFASPELASRVIDSELAMPPTYRADAIEAAAPIRYGGRVIGALTTRWIIDASVDHASACALLGAAAAALAPALRAALDRDRYGSGDASTTSPPARTLGLLGVSPAMDSLRLTIGRVASVAFHVLIEGESGSGKELVARALHQHGPRRHRRFCAVNCAALTDELLEAELFGHTRGAFTGALTDRAGLFEEADGGTLFLDEIGELTARGQAKLLRVLQESETRRIGENLPRRVDARVVAATNRDLRAEAAAGRFREDLFYRLNVIRITVPPLRARRDDIPVLARAFWHDAATRTGSRATLAPDTVAALARYDWPGNVRELHNVIMALAVHAPSRGRITPALLPLSIVPRRRRASGSAKTRAGQRAERIEGAHGTGAHEGDVDERNIEERNVGRPAVGEDDDTAGDDVPAAARHAADDEGRAAAAGEETESREADAREVAATAGDVDEGKPVSLNEARRAFEQQFVRAALLRAGGQQSRAARELGLSRQGLMKLMTRLGLRGSRTRPGAPGK